MQFTRYIHTITRPFFFYKMAVQIQLIKSWDLHQHCRAKEEKGELLYRRKEKLRVQGDLIHFKILSGKTSNPNRTLEVLLTLNFVHQLIII